MIEISEVKKIHELLIDNFGGTKGLRDRNALESAISRPFTTIEKQDLYPTPINKPAAIIESIIINHPFIDGNKRLGYVLMRLILLANDFDINATIQEKYDFVIGISEGKTKFPNIVAWLNRHVIPK